MATVDTMAVTARKSVPEAKYNNMKGSPSKFKAYSLRMRMGLRTAGLREMAKALKEVETATLKDEFDEEATYGGLTAKADQTLFAILMQKLDDDCVVSFCGDEEEEDEGDCGTALWHAMVKEFYHVSDTQVSNLEKRLMVVGDDNYQETFEPYDPAGPREWTFARAMKALDKTISDLAAVGHPVVDARQKAALVQATQDCVETQRLNIAATIALTAKGKTYKELRADIEDLLSAVKPNETTGRGMAAIGRNCYVCDKPDHIARDCPNNSQNQPSWRRGGRRGGGGRMRCFKCGKRGHIRVNCPEMQECTKCGGKGHTKSECKGAINFCRGADDAGKGYLMWGNDV